MKTHLTLILTLGAYLLTACQQGATPSLAGSMRVNEPTPTSQPNPDVEEYAVYNGLLANQFSGDDINQVFIVDHTEVNNPKHVEQDLKTFQANTALSPDLVSSFMERNQQPYPLKPVLDFGLEYELWTQEKVDELRALDEASGWKLFFDKYPDTYGFVYLSRVGFNADFSQALVYMSSYHYEQPIKGGYYLMVRQDGQWVIKNAYEWLT